MDKGLQIPFVQKETLFKAVFKEFKADNYSDLGLYKQELKEYKEILNLLPNTQDPKDLQTRSRMQARVAHNYYTQKDYKTASIYINKALKTQEELSKTERTSELYNVYIVKGEICLESKKEDSAFYYFKKAHNLIRKGLEYEYMSLKSFGEYYQKIGNYSKAIENYEAALKDMKAFKVTDVNYTSEITKAIADCYKLMGNEKEYLKYMEIYVKNKDEYEKKLKDNLQTAINSILKDDQPKNNKTTIYLWVFLGLTSVVTVYLYIKYKKAKIKKYRLQKEKSTIEQQNQKNIKALEEKLQISVDELIDDAKNNRASFFEKFQKVYPEFYNKLITRYPNLNTGELELLAYIYLNFPTKDIAAFTFRSYRTIQSRKYSLRKKLGLNTSDDFYIWLRNL